MRVTEDTTRLDIYPFSDEMILDIKGALVQNPEENFYIMRHTHSLYILIWKDLKKNQPSTSCIISDIQQMMVLSLPMIRIGVIPNIYISLQCLTTSKTKLKSRISLSLHNGGSTIEKTGVLRMVTCTYIVTLTLF